MLERILVPLDGSEVAEAVLGQACRLLRLKDATVTLFEAVPVPVQPEIEYATLLADMKAEAEQYIATLERQLKSGYGLDANDFARLALRWSVGSRPEASPTGARR